MELGVRNGVSTRALLAGRPNSLFCCDINPIPEVISDLARDAGVSWNYAQQSSIVPGIGGVYVDMLFIDTLHTKDQLAAELRRYSSYVQKWIVLHDTETYGFDGEGGGRGLKDALIDFLLEHPMGWRVEVHYKNNNGLTVLRRTQ
jgi:hypothetical protein